MDFRNCLSSEDYIFEIKNNEQLFYSSRMSANIKPIWSFKGHNNSIEGIHLVDENEFVTISHDCFVSVWALDNNKKNIKNFKLENPILCSSYYNKSKYLCVGMTNKNDNLCIIDIGNKKVNDKVDSQCNSIFCVNYFDEDRITYGSKEGCICLTDLNRKKNIYRYEEHGDCLNSCAWNSDYKIHIFSTYKGNVLFFDFRQNLPIYQNEYLHSKYSVNVVYSDSNYLYSGASDCLIKKFDLRYIDLMKPLEIYVGHTSPIRFLSFSRKYDNLFCSSSDNGSIKLWKTEKNVASVNRLGKSFAYPSTCVSTINTGCTFLPPLQGDLTNKTVTGRQQNKKIIKNFLQLNKITVRRNNRSGSNMSERNRGKPSDPLRNENNNKNKEKMGKQERISALDTYRKRTVTPNLQTSLDKRVPVVSRDELFNMIKRKGANKNKEILHNLTSKVYSKKNTSAEFLQVQTKGTRTSSKFKLSLTSHQGPTTSINNLSSSRNLKVQGKISENMLNDSIDRESSNIPLNPEQLVVPLFYNANDLVKSHIKKIKIAHPTVTMLNHRSRVSSMVWMDDFVLSTSWDQTVKCWNIRNYLNE
ncbi:WD domain, G-beta repeat domain containing protein [Plasmodium gonderi]|uniref:WD domain, G-beta repeat domain containing protein n=1 Tax=Plasmodium gonderi TaxID=77519 RepID=A0A1Y1JK81_PLAGO|nr:WD domain, G-beta repeat domain containing protein [Plasmodium gonderi]GAW80823.1 WD domain, G-beta repeat domain containing protein [Plasmodium gonderi]